MGGASTFLIAFILFLILFGGLCIWAVRGINEQRLNSSLQSSSSSSGSNTESFDDKDALTILIITTDGSDPRGFIAVRVDPAHSVIRTLAFPRDAVVYYDTSEIRLYELYSAQGIQETKSSLENLSGLTFDHYAIVSYANLEKIIDYFQNGLTFSVTENLIYNGNGLSINISSGLRTLSASQVADVLRYPSWSGGRQQAADVQAEVAAALINQYMRESRSSLMDKDFSTLVNLVKTDILISHYNDAKAGLAYLAKVNSGSICSVLSLEGVYKGSGSAIRFYTADNIIETLQSQFAG